MGRRVMEAYKLKTLFRLLDELDESFLLQLATVPQMLTNDFEDRAIITLAAGEISKRRNDAR